MRLVYEQYAFNVAKHPLHEGADALPESPPSAWPVRLIAYYLPQFHRIAENDAWWGAGFTEWTNVTKALPRYLGHQQPRLPADLGFYDLRQVETLREQAALAKRGGVYGFCIHHYWFSGRQILETPLRLLLENPDIDLPFCLNWANESWTRRWDGADQDVLLSQRYESGDAVRYAASVLPALRDHRYIRINGRPLIMLYRPGLLPDARAWLDRWRQFFIGQKIGDPYVVIAQSTSTPDPRLFGADAAAGFPPHNGGWQLPNERDGVRLLDPRFEGRVSSYAALAERTLANHTDEYRLLPGVCPAWDNEARNPGKGFSFYGSTPERYGAWLLRACEQAMNAPSQDERLLFVNAWNEWAEGAYLEPDRHFGYAYLAETRRVMDRLRTGMTTIDGSSTHAPTRSPFDRPVPSPTRALITRARRRARRLLPPR